MLPDKLDHMRPQTLLLHVMKKNECDSGAADGLFQQRLSITSFPSVSTPQQPISGEKRYQRIRIGRIRHCRCKESLDEENHKENRLP